MKSQYESTKVIELGSCAFRQWRATHSHCRFIHGYQLIAKFWFGGSHLDDKQWLVDFGGLKDLKAKLNYVFDHTTCVAGDDPELETFKELERKGLIQLRVFDQGVGIERTAKVVFDIAQQYIGSLTNGRCWVEKVEVFEHEDNSATYTAKSKAEPVEKIESPAVVVETLTGSTSFAEPLVEPDISAANITQTRSTAAPVINNVSSGKGGWFEGTTWG
jgi:6-pyruvoyltetrahydropterin/6-carboxytetrahydropterin synthase